MNYQVSTVYNKEMSFTATVDDFKVTLDGNASEDHSAGPGPKKLMLASLAACTGIDIVSILNKMKVEFSDFSIDVSASLTEEHPKIFKDVRIVYNIRLAENDQVKMDKAVHLSDEKYCGVSAMFKAFAKVTGEIRYL